MEVRTKFLVALAAFGLSAGIATVQADESIGMATRKVSYADLNLDSDVGAKVFYNRVQAAAKLVCAADDGRNLEVMSASSHCVADAVSSAVAQANHGRVTALYTHSKPTSMRLIASR